MPIISLQYIVPIVSEIVDISIEKINNNISIVVFYFALLFLTKEYPQHILLTSHNL